MRIIANRTYNNWVNSQSIKENYVKKTILQSVVKISKNHFIHAPIDFIRVFHNLRKLINIYRKYQANYQQINQNYSELFIEGNINLGSFTMNNEFEPRLKWCSCNY